MLLATLLLLLSLGLLVHAAGHFIRAAESIGLRFGLSPFVLGVSIVAIGTSLPELVSAVAAVLQGVSEIATGTAVGSNVTNVLLILGVAAVLGGGFRVDHELVRVDLPFLFGSALAFWMVASDGTVARFEGVACAAVAILYTVYAASGEKESPETTVAVAGEGTLEGIHPPEGAARSWAVLAAAIVGIQLGAYLTVRFATELAASLGVGNEVIAATVVAIGTSLPELVVCLRAALQGSPEIAVGNVIGSNVFNSVGVIGLSAIVGPLSVPAGVLAFALPAMVGVTVLAFFVLQAREMTRWDGWLLLGVYGVFLLQLPRF
ncbi:MAG: calcium/sodium antiporter [Myxococcota bacterium]|nr:calcium/sodium antiporter [Myxococcota bacterium]